MGATVGELVSPNLGIRNQTQFVIIVNTEYKPQAPENLQAAQGYSGFPVHRPDHHSEVNHKTPTYGMCPLSIVWYV